MNIQLVFTLLAVYLLVLCSNKTEGFWGFGGSSEDEDVEDSEDEDEDDSEDEVEAPHVHTPVPHEHGHASHAPVHHEHTAHTPAPHKHGHASHTPVPHKHGHASHTPVPHKHGHASHTPVPHKHGHASHTPVPHKHGHAAHAPVPHEHGHAAHAPVPHAHGHAAHAPVSHEHDYVEHTHAPVSHEHGYVEHTHTPAPFSIFDSKELSFIPKELRALVTDHQIEGLIGGKLDLILQGLKNICYTGDPALVSFCTGFAEIKKHILQNIGCLQHFISQIEDDDIRRGLVILKDFIPLGGDIEALSEEHKTTLDELKHKYMKLIYASHMGGTVRNIECAEALTKLLQLLLGLLPNFHTHQNSDKTTNSRIAARTTKSQMEAALKALRSDTQAYADAGIAEAALKIAEGSVAATNERVGAVLKVLRSETQAYTDSKIAEAALKFEGSDAATKERMDAAFEALRSETQAYNDAEISKVTLKLAAQGGKIGRAFRRAAAESPP